MQLMQFAGPALNLAGGVLSGVAAKKAGDQNRATLYGQALEEESAGNAQALRIRDQARKAIGDQAAAQWGNGFTGDSGSALDALTESQINATMDMMQVRRDAAMKARSMRAEGDQRASQGRFAMAEAIIGGASKAFGGIKDWGAAHSGELPAAPGTPSGAYPELTVTPPWDKPEWRFGDGSDPTGRNPYMLSLRGR